eukprot:CAMPEP_0204422308 /NCGR_PEP_ID=MMETSP0470-20130426/35401_1 /ASSEMBLY_ACC=CAM_ASM_000385 /TAXON_ID=2969 /ORGANISM="Oxyrrhis marina" /LENGTH=48 /DNA_ID= /DNA_START= /DNA_END= /DNA_ORIENTATION=
MKRLTIHYDSRNETKKLDPGAQSRGHQTPPGTGTKVEVFGEVLAQPKT